METTMHVLNDTKQNAARTLDTKFADEKRSHELQHCRHYASFKINSKKGGAPPRNDSQKYHKEYLQQN
jgi:hypothetical protein